MTSTRRDATRHSYTGRQIAGIESIPRAVGGQESFVSQEGDSLRPGRSRSPS
jgi:hypothetical protein